MITGNHYSGFLKLKKQRLVFEDLYSGLPCVKCHNVHFCRCS